MNPLAQSDLPRPDALLAADSPDSCEFTWLNVLLGQLLLRACPCGSKPDTCRGCQLGPLCHCAHGHPRASAVAESRFWVLLVLAVGLGLYSVLISAK